MKQYFIKTKFWKFVTDTLYVKDEREVDQFLIKQKFSIPKKWRILDVAGKHLFTVKKRMFRIFNRYDILDADKRLLAVIKRKFAFFVPKYKITNKVDESAQYSITGDILSWNFSIVKNGRASCEFRKQIIALTNNYFVKVFDESETMLSIAAIIALNNDRKEKQSRR